MSPTAAPVSLRKENGRKSDKRKQKSQLDTISKVKMDIVLRISPSKTINSERFCSKERFGRENVGVSCWAVPQTHWRFILNPTCVLALAEFHWVRVRNCDVNLAFLVPPSGDLYANLISACASSL